jgi:ribosomal protein S27AE
MAKDNWEPNPPTDEETLCPQCGRPMQTEFHEDEWLLWCNRCKDSYVVEPNNLEEKYE